MSIEVNKTDRIVNVTVEKKYGKDGASFTYDMFTQEQLDGLKGSDANVTQENIENSLPYVIAKDDEVVKGVNSFVINSKVQDYNSETFKDAIKDGNCNIVYIGTSITEGISQAENSNNWVPNFKIEIENKFKNVSFNHYNFGLGSRRLSDYINDSFQGMASEPEDKSIGFFREKGIYAWQTPSIIGKSWKDHVKDQAPDLLIIHFGMNDSDDDPIFKSNLLTLLSEVNSWSKIPTIVFVTEMMGSDSFVNNDRLIGYSRIIRDVATKNKCGLIDVNRFWRLLKEGVDENNIAYQRTNLNAYTQSSGTTPTSISSTHITHNTGSYDVENPIKLDEIDVGFSFVLLENASSSINLNFGTSKVEIKRDNVNFYINEVFNDSYNYTQLEHSISHSGRVTFLLGKILIYINGVLIGEFENDYYRSDTFKIGINLGTIQNLTIDEGRVKKIIKPLFPNDELIGLSNDEWANGNYSEGGNNKNHPSRIGLTEGFKPAIREFISSLNSKDPNLIDKRGDKMDGMLEIALNNFVGLKLKRSGNVNGNSGIIFTQEGETHISYLYGASPYYAFRFFYGATNIIDVHLNKDVVFAGNIKALGFKASNGSQGVTGSYTTADGKTVTVTDGLITSIV